MTPLPDPPERAHADGRYALGRYRQPFVDARFPVRGLMRWRLKEWHYTSVTTDRWLVAFAVVQLGYAANAFAYVVDRRTPDRRWEHEAISPLGRALSMAPSSVDGTTRWERGRDRVVVGFDEGWEISLDLGGGDRRLTGTLFVEGDDESLALLRALGGDRVAYTHKSAALPATGELRLGDERIEVRDGLAALDWTRSLADRHTRWRWASFAGKTGDGTRLGLNLSTDVYGDDENAAFVDGRVVPLSGVRFEVPAEPARQRWQIRSREGDEVELVFKPDGARRQDVDLKLARSRFVQPYGLFSGRVAGHTVDGVYGVVEDHDALW